LWARVAHKLSLLEQKIELENCERVEDMDVMVVKSMILKLVYNLDGRSQIESQLAVSMEINGILYHGILFAQSNRSRLS